MYAKRVSREDTKIAYRYVLPVPVRTVNITYLFVFCSILWVQCTLVVRSAEVSLSTDNMCRRESVGVSLSI